MCNKYNHFACPNPACSLYNQFCEGNIAHYSWIGKAKNIERLQCKKCFRAFSSRRGTLLEAAKISELQQTRLLKCFRWGVSDEGTADIAEVDVKTVRLFREKAAKRAQIHHDNEVRGIKASAVECDELFAKHRKGKTWVGAAIAVQSFLILAVILGARNQTIADMLLAQIWVRCPWVGMILTDGWRPYWSAVIRCFGRIVRPRRTELRGRLKPKKIDIKGAPFYGQVVKKANRAFSLVRVECRALIGNLAECIAYLKIYNIGTVIHTIPIERWWGSLRCNLAALRRRSRCLAFTVETLGARVWIFVSLYNWVLPHKTFSKKGGFVTPAMAAGLIDRPLTYDEYIWKVVLPTKEVQEASKRKLAEMNSEEIKRAARKTRPKPECQELWRAPPVSDRPQQRPEGKAA
jgi:IS1 family transposase